MEGGREFLKAALYATPLDYPASGHRAEAITTRKLRRGYRCKLTARFTRGLQDFSLGSLGALSVLCRRGGLYPSKEAYLCFLFIFLTIPAP